MLWSMDNLKALQKAVDLSGGTLAGLARLIGTTPQAINNWKMRRRIPPAKAARIEAHLGGRVKKEALCPEDLAPKVFRSRRG